jgi:hypothetical protein
VLVCLSPRDDSGLLVGLATRAIPVPGNADQIAVEACWALGNAKFSDPQDPTIGQRLADAVRDAWCAPTSPQLLEAWAYALAMSGRRNLLSGLVAPPDASGAAAWERARQWWLEVPAYLLEHPDRGRP